MTIGRSLPESTVGGSPRILAMDATRGLALLGIFFVNAAFMGMPLMESVNNTVPSSEGPISVAVWAFTATFCTGKFFPLFSLLFGMGLAMMFLSAQRSGRSFAAAYARRLAGLATLGFLHVALLWYGDILLVYAIIGIAMFLMVSLSPRLLAWSALALYLLTIAISLPVGLLMQIGGGTAEPVKIDTDAPLFLQWVEVLTSPLSMADPRLSELEVAILGTGPFWQAALVRMVQYMLTAPFIVLAMAPLILACFCVGTAMVKAKIGAVDTEAQREATARWTGRFIAAGAFVGLPMSIASVSIQASAWPSVAPGIAEATSFALASAGRPLMSRLSLSLDIRLCQQVGNASSPAAIVIDAFARLGRIGLTGYLASTLCMSVFMAHWGLGMFGQTTWAERFVLVLLIFGGLLVFAGIWTRVFAVGPLEAVLRSVTYLRWPWSAAASTAPAAAAAVPSPSSPSDSSPPPPSV
ncbi:MAG: DUF418 domain-containing protein [Planctomyces sp.]